MTSQQWTVGSRQDRHYTIADLVDIEQIRGLFEQFTRATGFTIGFLDHPQMDVLAHSGWRGICTEYHRKCPAALDACTRSNRQLVDQLDEPGKLVIEPCDNGLVDCATPIIVQGEHVATLATGQVLLAEPDLERFRRQALEFGFDEEGYLAALAEVPVVDERRLMAVTAFLGEMALVISQIGYAKLAREREVDERLKAEAELRESEARYRALFEGAAEGILVADIDTKVLQYANPSACELFGYSQAEMTGMTIQAIHPEDAWQDVVAEFEAQARGEKVLASEIPCLRKDGTVFYADITTRTTVLEGRVMNVGFFSDVTERMQAQEARRDLETQLAHSGKMEAIGRLAGGVAHDFNNLLSVILGYAEYALRKTREGDPLYMELKQIVGAGERAATLTHQLLAFSRKQALKLELLDLNTVVSQMEKMLTRTIGEDVELDCSLGRSLGVIRGDQGQIEQVIMNLTLNARDAMPDGGRLVIKTANSRVEDSPEARLADLAPGDYVILSVTDTGCGMDEDTRAQIFEPFFTTKGHGKGTGLGLSTVYGIVRQSGGTIRIDSVPGEGACFRIFLPRVDERISESLGEQSEEGSLTGTETILITEDDEAVRNLAGQILRDARYTVHTAANGGEALLICEELGGAVDLLLTDVVMPRMHGRALADRLARISPGLKVLYMSGYTHDVIVPHGVLEAGKNFIEKPFSMEALARKVREVLDG